MNGVEVNLRLAAWQIKWLHRTARQRHTSISDVMRQLILDAKMSADAEASMRKISDEQRPEG
jgi:macrodomain Ter protein organizer (MatP/YcbG family)